MKNDRYVQWAWLVRDLRDNAVSQWRATYAPAVPLHELLANELRRIRVVVDEYPRGYYTIAVNLRARYGHQNEWYYWKVAKVAGYYHIY